MLVILVDWTVAEGDAVQFAALLQAQAATSLADEPDCHRFDVAVHQDRPGRFLLYEIYTDAAAFEAHLATDHFAAFDAAAAPLTLSKTVSRLQLLGE